MSVKMKPGDPAYWMLFDGVETTPVVHKQGCYICEDPEFAQMGLSLCRKCPFCGGHVAADHSVCDDCGIDDGWYYDALVKIDEGEDLEVIAAYVANGTDLTVAEVAKLLREV